MTSSIACMIVLAALAGQTLEELEEAEGKKHKSSSSSGDAVSRGPFGLGIILGEPSGLSAKVFVSGPHSIQGHFGFGIGRRGFFILIIDYIFHIQELVPPLGDVGFLWPYVGAGGRIGINKRDDPILGLRLPIGASFGFNVVPVEIFAEFAVGLGLFPETRAIFDGGIGGRYYF